MGPPDIRLPRLRRKGRAWYYDTQGKPRRWIALGSNWPAALKRYQELAATPARAGTVDAALADYLDSLAGKRSDGTLGQYRAYRMHLSAVFGHLTLLEVTPADVLRYLDECPRTSARSEIAVLSGAYRLAMRKELVAANPCAGARSDRPRSKRLRYLSDAELAAIRAAAPPLLQVAIDLAYLTGLRVSELIALRWEDFGLGAVSRLKDGRRSRYRMTPDLRSVLAAAKRLQAHPGPLVLMRDGAALTRYQVGEAWRKACAAAGIVNARWHDIRAKAATDHDAAGGDATALLGHRSRQTTETYLRGREIAVIDPVRPRRVELPQKRARK